MHRLLTLILLALFCWTQPVTAQSCTDDIVIVSDVGCDDSCCYEYPIGSGHYYFTHVTVDNIDIRTNSSAIQSVTFSNLVSVEQRIRISYNQAGALKSVSFPSLRVAGKIEMVSNPSLIFVDLPQIMSIDGENQDAYLRVQSNPSLTWLNVPMLRDVVASEAGSAYVDVDYNGALNAVDLPRLQSVRTSDEYGEAYIYIGDNPSAQRVNLGSLARLVGGEDSISYLIVYEMAALRELSCPRLVELLPAGGADDFSEVTIGNCPLLTEFVMPKLQRVSLLQLIELKGTHRAMFPSLSELQYLWVWRSCAGTGVPLELYVCGDSLVDVMLDDGDGLCSPGGYRLASESSLANAYCEASEICETFSPGPGECSCGSPGTCSVAH